MSTNIARRHALALPLVALVSTKLTAAAPGGMAFFEGLDSFCAHLVYLRRLLSTNAITLGAFCHGIKRVTWLTQTWCEHRAEIEAGTFGHLQLSMLEGRKLSAEATGR